MKQVLFTFLFLSTIILASCRKDKVQPDIKQYDDEQINAYIKSNGLTGMQRDTTDGDTTGIYYQILEPGTGPHVQYDDYLAMVYTIHSFDGKYNSTDTILNHYGGNLGSFSSLGLPKGLQLAIYNNLKYKGGSMRLLIPSHLAYGKNGYGSGSSGNVNGRIAGNQCLDYFVRIVDDQDKYDDLSIQKYKTANSLNDYLKTASGVYYKITGTDTSTAVVGDNSKITATYNVKYLNNTVVANVTDEETIYIESAVPGVQEGLKLAKPGQTVSLIVPSRLAYGPSANTNGTPAFTCLYYQYNVKSLLTK